MTLAPLGPDQTLMLWVWKRFLSKSAEIKKVSADNVDWEKYRVLHLKTHHTNTLPSQKQLAGRLSDRDGLILILNGNGTDWFFTIKTTTAAAAAKAITMRSNIDILINERHYLKFILWFVLRAVWSLFVFPFEWWLCTHFRFHETFFT